MRLLSIALSSLVFLPGCSADSTDSQVGQTGAAGAAGAAGTNGVGGASGAAGTGGASGGGSGSSGASGSAGMGVGGASGSSGASGSAGMGVAGGSGAGGSGQGGSGGSPFGAPMMVASSGVVRGVTDDGFVIVHDTKAGKLSAVPINGGAPVAISSCGATSCTVTIRHDAVFVAEKPGQATSLFIWTSGSGLVKLSSMSTASGVWNPVARVVVYIDGYDESGVTMSATVQRLPLGGTATTVVKLGANSASLGWTGKLFWIGIASSGGRVMFVDDSSVVMDRPGERLVQFAPYREGHCVATSSADGMGHVIAPDASLVVDAPVPAAPEGVGTSDGAFFSPLSKAGEVVWVPLSGAPATVASIPANGQVYLYGSAFDDHLAVWSQQATVTITSAGGKQATIPEGNLPLFSFAEFTPDGARWVYMRGALPDLPELVVAPTAGGPITKLASGVMLGALVGTHSVVAHTDATMSVQYGSIRLLDLDTATDTVIEKSGVGHLAWDSTQHAFAYDRFQAQGADSDGVFVLIAN